MRSSTRAAAGFVLLFLPAVCGVARADEAAPAERSFAAPRGQTVSVKMIGPVTQTTDLQILCILAHDPAGDRYIEAMADFDAAFGGLLSGLRDRGEFAGDLGETLLFTPPAGSITPKRVLLVGVGPEADLTPARLNLVGRIAAREATRLGAAHVSFAPTLRDQGSSRIDVAEGDAAFVEGWLLAYDTEMRLREQRLSPVAEVSKIVIEAGPKYFDSAAAAVDGAIVRTRPTIEGRVRSPYGDKK